MALSLATFAAPRAVAPATWETDNVLSAWLVTGAPPGRGGAAIGRAPAPAPAGPRLAAELVYDTEDQALPTGIRAAVKEGSRRLLYAADEFEVLLRITPAHDADRFELVGQVLHEGVPVAGVPVRLADAPLEATTDRGGSFRLGDLPAGTCALEVHFDGHVVDVAPVAVN